MEVPNKSVQNRATKETREEISKSAKITQKRASTLIENGRNAIKMASNNASAKEEKKQFIPVKTNILAIIG